MTSLSSPSAVAAVDGRLLFRPPAGERWMLFSCALLFVLLATFVAGAGVVGTEKTPLLLFMLAPALAIIGSLTVLIIRETAAAFRLRIVIDGGVVRLRLPRRRGHVLLPAVDRNIPLSMIKAIETRGETFRQLGVIAIQQAFRLVLSDKTAIDLGADRQFKETVIGDAATALAARAGIGVRNIGMVDGRAGVLAVWGTSCPPWSTPSIATADIEKRMIGSSRAWRIMAMTAVLFQLVRLIARR